MKEEKLEKLNAMFGTYRAEWLNDKIFKFFAVPSYFAELKGNRPCVLQGGRGTGKTTVLRGLSYKGQWALCKQNIVAFDSNDFIGIYLRFNTNHTHAFEGIGADRRQWQRIFAHYLNLLICKEILQFVEWHKKLSASDEELSPHACNLVAATLNIDGNVTSRAELYEEIELSMYRFQADVNNIADGMTVKLSMQSEPINVLTQKLVELSQFDGKMFYVMMDEYENLTDDEQEVVNTYLKHNNKRYTFKIGVRELGWRVKHTLNHDELLTSMADYALIPIEDKFYKNEKLFTDFATDVCEQRIQALMEGENENYKIEQAFAPLSYEDEALLLKVESSKYYSVVNNYLRKSGKDLGISPLYMFTLGYWADKENRTIEDVITEYENQTALWNQRYDNYKYSMLFKIRSGRGSGLKKYYAGWSTILKMANGNIRYVLEMVYHSYVKHLSNDLGYEIPVPPRIQTEAAYDVGGIMLQDLEQEAKNGYKLSKLVINIGSFFNQLATDSDYTAPEITEFYIEEEISPEVEEYLKSGVMHMAFIRMPNNKNTNIGATKDYLYSLHPAFAARFVYSFRRKRKIVITNDDFLSLAKSHKQLIERVLSKNTKLALNRDDSTIQLNLFDDMQNDKS